MASIQERGGSYRVIFRFRGKQHFVALGKVDKAEAEAKRAQVDYLLMRIKQGLVELPPGTDIAEFVRFDGNPPARPVEGVAKPVAKTTIEGLRDRYIATHEGALEPNSLYTIGVHFRHLIRILGKAFPLAGLARGDLQRYVDARAREKVSPVTAKKEIATFRASWNWGEGVDLVAGPFPSKGLVYPKIDEKPPFQTRAEIERQIARGGLSEAAQAELWESLFLTLPEITELLGIVRGRGGDPCAYPMFVLAAHTGMRRSELLRARVTDVDFEGETILVREKKRQKGKRTMRRAPLSTFLADVLRGWLATHPGGQALFVNPGESGPPTVKEAYGIFRRAVEGTGWEVMRGWHVLRHSFITGCVSAGVDQRLIDDWVGHTTEEMRRRYRHLVPSAQRQAIKAVFG